MANRRFGGGLGGQRGGGFNNRSFGGGGGGPQSNINPWQGGGPSGGGGNAPPLNSNNSNIQNQLAMALSSLIQQTKPQPPSGPPSLLSMNNQSGFYNQDNFNQSQNRFGGNRGGQDFRPFNKNGAGGGARPWGGQGPPNRIVKRPGNFRNNNRNNQRSPVKGGFVPKKTTTPVKSKATPVKNEDKKEETEDKDGENKKEETEGAEKRTPAPTQFDGLPKGLLHCFICLKSMWDGESFQNHIGGKAHRQMIGSLEESFQITVNILRENMRLSEERKMIEIHRYQRLYRQKNIDMENYCNMCDLKFVGKIAVHRQTEGHQRLKKFLHPKCNRCNLEFPYRMEWVDHHFSKEHLFKLKDFLDAKNFSADDYKVKIQAEMDIEPLLEETVHNEDDNPVLELNDDLNNLFNRIPTHKRTRPICKASLEAASGFICNLCKYFMTTKEESEAHLKTANHHKHFVKALKAKHQKALNKKKKAEEAEAAAANGEGEAKEEEEEEKKEGEGDDENKELEDMYDPFEADGNEEEKEEKAEVKKEEDEVAAKEEEQQEDEPMPEVKAEPEVKPEVKAEIKKEAAAAAAPATPNTRAKRVVKSTPAAKAKKGKN